MAMTGPEVVYEFEEAAAEFVGARYAVATTSCTMGIFLALQYLKHNGELGEYVECPAHTYVGVPMSIIHSGCKLLFDDALWEGQSFYRLRGTPVIDAARIFERGMYIADSLMVTSHHWNKPLGLSQGGIIFTDDSRAQAWLRRARFDGRTPGVPLYLDRNLMIGWHAYMSPEVAAQGLQKLMFIGDGCRHPVEGGHYPSMFDFDCFKPHMWQEAA